MMNPTGRILPERIHLSTGERRREDEASYFRVKISIEKQTYFRSASEPVTLFSEPASGLYTLKNITITYAPGTGAGGTGPGTDVIEEGARFTPKANTFTRNTEDGLVFTGWSASFHGATAKLPSGTVLAEGAVIDPTEIAVTLEAASGIASPSITLTAQWSSAKVIYVNNSTGNDSRDGLTEANAVKTLEKAYQLLPDGRAETNIIQLLSNYSCDKYLNNGSYKRNVTIRGKGNSITTITPSVTSVTIRGDLILQDISLMIDGSNVAIFCNRYKFIVDTTAIVKGKQTYSTSDGAGFGVPGGTSKMHVYSLESDTTIVGPRGTSEDNPVIVKILGEGSNLARLVGGGVVMPSGSTTQENPAYVDITVGAGDMGIVCSGSVDGQANGKSYISSKITVTGGNIYSVIGGQHANGDNGTSSALYGGFQFYMYGGKVTTLYGGTLGRRKSYDNVSNLDTELNIFDGTINTIYGGGATGAFNGTIQINIHGGTIGTFYGGGYGVSPYVSDYHNDTALVTGTVDTHIYGGTINGDIYAGGGGDFTKGKTGSARIVGNVSLEVSGGTVKGNVFGGGAGVSGDKTAAKITGDVALTISGGTIEKNVYGGGNLGSIDGNTSLTVTGSPSIGGVIYGGGNSSGTIKGTEVLINTGLGTVAAPKNVFGAGNGSGTQVETSKVTIGPQADFYGTVYGGGEQGGTGQATVDLTGGTVHGDVYGGGNAASVGGTVTVKSRAGSTVTGNIYGGSNSTGSISGLVSLEIAGAAKNVFGAGNGSSTSAAAGTNVTVLTGAAVGENVYGGGAEGTSTSTEVILNGGTIEKHVFGGGNLVGTGTATIKMIDGSKVKGSIYGGSNDQGAITETKLSITGSYSGSIFGGGFGTGTSVKTTSVTAENQAILTGNIYGGGEQGAVEQSGVTLKAGSNVANVFGGGSQANVTTSAALLVDTGAESGNVYGGSNNSGTVKSPVITIRGKAASVYGAGKGSPTITTAPAVIAESGAVITAIYGGGDAGQTQNGTTVTLKNGSTSTNVFGGGNAAGITGAVIVSSEAGSKVSKLYGGSNSSGTVTQTTVTVNGTVGGAGQPGTADGPGAVYGGGLGGSTQTVTPKVVISAAGIVNGEVFGGGAEGPVTGNTEVTLDSASKVNGNVYAGGDAAIVKGSTLLTAQENSAIAGSLFGGGKGTTAEIQTDTRVIVFGNVTEGNVFGGGAEGAVIRNTHVDIAKGIIDGNGTDTGNVFGGSDKAKVHGDTLVHIGKEAADGTSTSVENVSLIIKGTVFGRGNTTDNGSTFDASDPFVLGDSMVSVVATGYDTPNFNIYKSIFGDGNMCTVKGKRTVRLMDYKALGDQANTSIQRADSLTLENCSIELLGAVDSANLVPTVAYSLNRINDLVFKGGSTLKIQAPVNLVKNLKSQDGSGNPVTSGATDSVGQEPSVKNIVNIQQGVQMELRTSEDVTTVGYGQVSGYFLLDVYDREDKKIESGIYVLGGYEADERLGGFLYGSGEHAFQKITPSTDESTWRNWAIGTDMVLTRIMVMSDKPAGEKILQLDSPWPADGTIYRLVEDSVKISTTLTDGSEFILKDPEDIAAPDEADTTLGITVGAGNQGWINPVSLGYIKGSSRNGASGNGFGGMSSEPLQTINNRSLKPTIQVELTNRIGIQNSDTQGDYPLTVEFAMENVKKLSDTSFSSQGKLTVVLQIRREATPTYDDILMASGKEYVRGTQTYTFSTAGGTGGAPGMTISKQSAITLQYARKTENETQGARDHKLSFSTGDTPATTGTPLRLPAGVTILAVDRADTYPVYAHYTVPAGGVSELLLSEFTINGTNQHYNQTSSTNDKENYLFVFDFAGAPNWSQNGACVTFEPVYESAQATPAKTVFSVASDPREYRMASPDATGATAEGKAYDREAVIPVTVTTWAGNTLGVDTTGTGMEMGARLRLKNREAGIYVPVPMNDWLVKSGGETYYPTRGDITVPLGSSRMEATVSFNIVMKENSLPAGKYQWEMQLVSAALAEYPGGLTDTPLYLNFSLVDKQYSIEADWKTPSASRLYPSVSATARTPLEWKAKLQADNGAATDNVSLKIILQKKDATSGNYSDIDFGTLFTNVSGMSRYEAWNTDVSGSYQLKDTLPEGTYRLRFELVDRSGGTDRTLTSDTENFIVTP